MKKMIQFFYRSMILMSIMLFYGHVQGYGQKLVLLDSFIYDQSYLERYGLLHEVLPGIILSPTAMADAKIDVRFDYIDPSGQVSQSNLQNVTGEVINHIENYVYLRRTLYKNQEYLKYSDSLIAGLAMNNSSSTTYRYPMIVKCQLTGKNQLKVIDSVLLTGESIYHEDRNTQRLGTLPWMITSPGASEGGGCSPYYEFYGKNLQKCAVIPSGVPSGCAISVAIYFIGDKIHLIEQDPIQKHIISWMELDQISLRVLKKNRFVLDSTLSNNGYFSVSDNHLFVQLARIPTKENKTGQLILAECTQGKSAVNYLDTQGLHLDAIYEKQGNMVARSMSFGGLTLVKNRDFSKPFNLKWGHISLLNERYVIIVDQQLESIYLYEIQ